MRILASSDWHIDQSTGGWPRAADVLEQISCVVQRANDEAVDLFVFAGDLMEGHAPDERSWTLLAAVAERLDELEMPSLLIAGNHDVVDRAGCRSVLAPLATYEFLESSGRHVAEGIELWGPHVGYWKWDCSVLCLPHISPAHVDLHYEGMERTLDEYVDNCCREELDGVKGPVVVVSHLELAGIEYGSEQDMPCGTRPAKLPAWLDTDPHVVVIGNGHYHTGQKVGNKTHVVGSLERLSFGEAGDDKGILLLEV